MLEGSEGDQAKAWHEALHHLTLPSDSSATLTPASLKSLRDALWIFTLKQ